MAAQDSRTIKSAHRVLEILEFFDQDRRSATVMDISRALSYPQSSTSELLRCLTRLGYLHYNRFRRTYSPTARVALLGAWVEPSFFRGGPVLSAIDAVANATGETVALSMSTNYSVQHLHIIHGNTENAVDAHVGEEVSLLHSPQGRLLLASLRDEHIKSALHRLNAEEEDPSLRVKVNDMIEELRSIRLRGWLVMHDDEGVGSVSVLLPRRKGMNRLAMSVMAQSHVIEARGEEMLRIIIEQRDLIDQPAASAAGDRSASKIFSFSERAGSTQQDNYRNQFA